MRKLLLNIYRAIFSPIIILIFIALSLFSKKIRIGLNLRRVGPMNRKPLKQSPIWIHAASGEYEYAKPLVRLLKSKHPDIPILVTYFTPSFVKSIQADANVDCSEALPLDLPGPVNDFLKFYKPLCLIVARTDLWPEVLNQCAVQSIPVALLSAKQPQPSVFSFLIQPFRKVLFTYLTRIFTIDPDSTNYFQSILDKNSVIQFGDTRYDQVFYRLNQIVEIKNLSGDNKAPILCAGSTWPEDEKYLLPAIIPLLKSNQLRLIIAPHELHSSHLNNLIQQFQKSEIKVQKYSELNHWEAPVLVVDQIGILAKIYEIADIAFVGGAFKAKVHSVMEPLAAGLVTIVGPLFKNSPEAIEFANNSSFSLKPVQVCRSTSEITQTISDVLDQHLNNSVSLASLRVQIKNALLSKTGATEKVFLNIENWILKP